MCIIVLNHDTTTLLMYVLLNDEYSKLNCQIFSVVSVYILYVQGSWLILCVYVQCTIC